ncbi:heme-binding protein [Mycobacterium sp. SMC-2]|uniref:heme-binding protein n=1 Tax=Mycobacterium sp. SMC-2 TaxID=2857058 RepID=UPI00220646D6|nr:heme-binding protein [Mycobacterium sp. SMC-2]
MVSFARGMTRAIAGGIAAGAASVAMLFTGAGAAGADPGPDAPDPAPSPAPNCTAADLAQISAGVAAATSAYLFTHPDVNAYFTSLRGQSRNDIRDQLKQYMDANPQTHADLEGIRQPLTDFQNRCQ